MKKLISFMLCAAIVITGVATAYAADNAQEKKPELAAAVDMDFTGTPIKLSLEAAVKRMQSEGVRAEELKANDLKDKSVASGYSEAVISIRDSLNSSLNREDIGGFSSSQYTTADEKSKKLSRDFAKANLKNNHEAEINKIEQDAVDMYYGVLLAQENVKSARDNLSIQESLLSNVQKKLDAGVAAKKDLLSQQASVTEARSRLDGAKAALNGLKMNFNITMGYPLTQAVDLADTLEEAKAPDVSLEQAIKNAKENRMELKDASLQMQIQEIALNNLGLTVATNSAAYLRAQVTYMNLKQAADNAPLQMEMDIRNQYMGLAEKSSALKSARESLDFAKESLHLAQISYDAGVSTLTDVQNAQLAAFRSSQSLSSAIKDYNLAVNNFKFAQGAGTKRVPL